MALSTTGMLRIGANVSIPSSLKHQQQHRVSAPGMMVVECSSRPQKKATAHHMKSRPKKRQRWDIKRGSMANLKGKIAVSTSSRSRPATMVSEHRVPITASRSPIVGGRSSSVHHQIGQVKIATTSVGSEARERESVGSDDRRRSSQQDQGDFELCNNRLLSTNHPFDRGKASLPDPIRSRRQPVRSVLDHQIAALEAEDHSSGDLNCCDQNSFDHYLYRMGAQFNHMEAGFDRMEARFDRIMEFLSTSLREKGIIIDDLESMEETSPSALSFQRNSGCILGDSPSVRRNSSYSFLVPKHLSSADTKQTLFDGEEEEESEEEEEEVDDDNDELHEQTLGCLLRNTPAARRNVNENLLPASSVRQNIPSLAVSFDEYYCDLCLVDCSHKRYHYKELLNYDVCTDCYDKARFGTSLRPYDFILVEAKEDVNQELTQELDDHVNLQLQQQLQQQFQQSQQQHSQSQQQHSQSQHQQHSQSQQQQLQLQQLQKKQQGSNNQCQVTTSPLDLPSIWDKYNEDSIKIFDRGGLFSPETVWNEEVKVKFENNLGNLLVGIKQPYISVVEMGQTIKHDEVLSRKSIERTIKHASKETIVQMQYNVLQEVNIGTKWIREADAKINALTGGDTTSANNSIQVLIATGVKEAADGANSVQFTRGALKMAALFDCVNKEDFVVVFDPGGGMFSETKVCLSNSEKEKFDELKAWVCHFVQKMLMLTDQNFVTELVVEHVDSKESGGHYLLQQNADTFHMTRSGIKCFVYGHENYVLEHGDIVEQRCHTYAKSLDKALKWFRWWEEFRDGVIVHFTRTEHGGKGYAIKQVLVKIKLILWYFESISAMSHGEEAKFKMKLEIYHAGNDDDLKIGSLLSSRVIKEHKLKLLFLVAICP